MSYELILPFFPEELRALLRDPSISDLMINGTTGVYADKGGVLQAIPLAEPYTNDKLQQAIQRIARLLGQDLTHQNPILNTRLPDGSRVAVVGAAVFYQRTFFDHSEVQSLVYLRRIDRGGKHAKGGPGHHCQLHGQAQERHHQRRNRIREDHPDEGFARPCTGA